MGKVGIGDRLEDIKTNFGQWEEHGNKFYRYIISSLPGICIILNDESGDYIDEQGIEQWDEEQAEIEAFRIYRDPDDMIFC